MIVGLGESPPWRHSGAPAGPTIANPLAISLVLVGL